MKKTTYPTAQDAENAFYEALERGDVEAMMEVWAEDEEIVCVHPGGERLVGYEAVRTSWTQFAASGQKLRVHLSDQSVMTGMMLAVHSLHENVTVEGERRRRPVPVAATNVYLRTSNGWRMIVHHASPVPEQPPSQSPVPDTPKVLH